MFEIFSEGSNLARLFIGLWVTLKIALISILFSCVFGVIFGVLMTINNFAIRAFFRLYLESIRIIPILVWLFLIFFGLPQISSISLDSITSAIIVFVAWGSIEMADLVRGTIESIPRHQIESARALGMNYFELSKYVMLPQIIARMLPLGLNLSTRIIKTTSLAPLIGVVEVLKTGQQIIEASILTIPSAPFWIYGFIFFLYFIACYPLSLLGAYLEKKYRF